MPVTIHSTPEKTVRVRATAAVVGLLLFAALGRQAPAAEPVGPSSLSVDPAKYSALYYVDLQHGNDFSADGSLNRPWRTFQHSLESVAIPPVGRRVAILVGAGVYLQPTFALKPRVDLYGGFASPGGERDVYSHPTVFDGEETHRLAIGSDDTRVDGVQFIRGRVRGKGAALLCDGTSPTIVDCVFRDNRTLAPADWNPPHLHQTANDGGAIACLNGAAPAIERNYFFENTTECGRGGGVACDLGAHPRIAQNVFANNRAGLDDPMRSGDGGAISIFHGSNPEVAGNVIVANQSLDANDSGGIWVALWSSPDIVGNVIVGNVGADDAGGLFIGGQEHRYDQPLDPYPPAGQFLIRVEHNVLVGNRNTERSSGAMRITMESRVLLKDNLVAENEGGMYLQRSEITAENNTVWQDWKFVEDKPSLGPSSFSGNILKGPAGPVEARVTIRRSMVEPTVKGEGDLPVSDLFVSDGVDGGIESLRYDALTFATILTLSQPLPAGGNYAGRPLCVGGGKGQWRVIKSVFGREVTLWGRTQATTKPAKAFTILRTFTLRPDAPSGLGARPPS